MILDSIELFVSVLAISILHAILPNHWLPVVAISRQLGWDGRKTAGVTMLAALAHSLSTVLIRNPGRAGRYVPGRCSTLL